MEWMDDKLRGEISIASKKLLESNEKGASNF